MRTVAFCEIDPYCRKVLAKHWPSVPVYSDVRELSGQRLWDDGNTVSIQVVCGGFPCQDISFAGKGAGLAGERSGLWREYARIIGDLRPRYVIVENVAALLGRGLGTILGDLAEIGYDAEWHCIRASDIGAIHERDRIWIIAYPIGSRGARLVSGADFGTIRPWGVRGPQDLQSIADTPFEPGDRWPQPLLRRVDDGLPGRVDRLRALGNAVIPQIPEAIGRAIMQFELPSRIDT